MTNLPSIMPPSSQEANYGQQWLQTVVQIGVGLILGWFAHKLSVRREDRNRVTAARDAFLAVVAEQRAKLDLMKGREGDFFEQSIQALTLAVSGIKHFLPGAHWTRLYSVLQEYKSHSRHEFDPLEIAKAHIAAGFTKDTGIGTPKPIPDQLLREFLQRFEDCIREGT